MGKYRKKPVVIEAFQWTGGPDQTEDPAWMVDAMKEGEAWVENKPNTEIMELHILTLEGTMTAQIGDYIIQGVQGEIYPCKPEIFKATYEEEIPIVPDFECDQCKGITKHSYCCENPACPNMPCCGKPQELCECTYEPVVHLFDRKKFKKAYDKALESSVETFIFEGEEYLVAYAKYLIEYFNNLENDKKRKA